MVCKLYERDLFVVNKQTPCYQVQGNADEKLNQQIGEEHLYHLLTVGGLNDLLQTERNAAIASEVKVFGE